MLKITHCHFTKGLLRARAWDSWAPRAHSAPFNPLFLTEIPVLFFFSANLLFLIEQRFSHLQYLWRFFQKVCPIQKFVLYKVFYSSQMTQTVQFLNEVMSQASHDQVITKPPSFLWRIPSPCSTPDGCQPFLATVSITHTFINILGVLNYNYYNLVYWYAKRKWKKREEISNINIINIKLAGLGTVASTVKRCFNEFFSK